MKISFLALCVGMLAFSGAHGALGAEHRVLLYETNTDRGADTNQWWLSLSRLERLPKWNPQRVAEPPLSVKKALKAARKWILTRGVGGGDVEEIVLRPVHPDEAPFSSVFYYRIRFGVAPFGNHLICIVLMDGSVLEPESHDRTETRKWMPIAEMRARLAQLRKGMPLQEVKGILNVDLAVGASSTTWGTYEYPGPMWQRGAPPPWEEAGYSLSLFFSSLDGPETLKEARLTSRTGESESWPK
jgi:hypothetical protein